MDSHQVWPARHYVTTHSLPYPHSLRGPWRQLLMAESQGNNSSDANEVAPPDGQPEPASAPVSSSANNIEQGPVATQVSIPAPASISNGGTAGPPAFRALVARYQAHRLRVNQGLMDAVGIMQGIEAEVNNRPPLRGGDWFIAEHVWNHRVFSRFQSLCTLLDQIYRWQEEARAMLVEIVQFADNYALSGAA